MNELSTTILSDAGLDYIPFNLPATKEVYFKVLKSDPENRRAVVKIKFGENASMPRHFHHCRAFAYTISGEWEYENGSFKRGDIAYESHGEEHTPTSEHGAEMIILFDSDTDDFLDNYLPDGTVITLGVAFMQAMERISLVDAANIDLHSIVKVTPPPS